MVERVVDAKKLDFKKLTLEELRPGLLDSFERRQKVVRVWKNLNGKRILVLSPFIDDWDNRHKDKIVMRDFSSCIRGGGVVFCALCCQQIVGFAALMRKPFGSRKQYVDLQLLHVSANCRNMGLGKRLFSLCAVQAAEWGAKKIYISAHSAEETQAFYKRLGCVDAAEPSQFHIDLDAADCQMEYVLPIL